NRLVVTIPLLAIAAILTQLDFNVLWRYFSWSNQTLAMITLWMITAYRLKNKDSVLYSLISAVPATFMSAVSMTYILIAKEGLRLPKAAAYPAGIVFACACFAFYIAKAGKRRRELN
ncbi:MAG: carbon starvation protein A, partial [Spirochaetales bacterium]|nr:carbon starvation protein A [Spirochaetales bacterium]